ncbi:MAG: serine/threonine-protein phosphatase [Clostridia bacterium]|nr:serine/threonine-protein phosphatase [Clostridia bacterium]
MKICDKSFNFYDDNSVLEIGAITTIGDRNEQQDCIGYEIKPDEIIAVLCDGMGGHAGGGIASQLVVEHMLNSYSASYPQTSINDFFVENAIKLDKEVSELSNEDNTKMYAGTTIVSVIIRERTLYWLSVGDSRIYLFRNGKLARPTIDHNYSLLLDEQYASGEISTEDYSKEAHKGQMLVSFLGVGGLPMIDFSSTPFELISGDAILLTSDGMYRNLPEDEICTIIQNYTVPEDAVIEMEKRATKHAKATNSKRDNASVLLLKIK